MTLEEIAEVLGVRTPAEVAKALGVPVETLRAAAPEPVRVLDYRGGEEAGRWASYAKPAIPPLKKKLGLDPRTGLKAEKKVRKGKR